MVQEVNYGEEKFGIGIDLFTNLILYLAINSQYHDHRSLFKFDNFLLQQVFVLLAMCWETFITMKEGLDASSAID